MLRLCAVAFSQVRTQNLSLERPDSLKDAFKRCSSVIHKKFQPGDISNTVRNILLNTTSKTKSHIILLPLLWSSWSPLRYQPYPSSTVPTSEKHLTLKYIVGRYHKCENGLPKNHHRSKIKTNRDFILYKLSIF